MRWLVALMVGCWILLIPPNAGPDEPVHTVRGAALVRGDPVANPLDDQPGYARYDVPTWVGQPDPACYAFKPDVAASCLLDQPAPDPAMLPVAVIPSDAPIWGSAMAGLGTLLPERWGATWGPRLFDALLPTALIAWALGLAHRSSRSLSAGVLVAVTPMTWFTIAVVNPSGLAIAGGLALWVALGLRVVGRSEPGPASLLATLGWAALVVPRRDGLMWASLIVAIFVLVARDDPRRLWNWLRPREQLTVAGSAAVFAVWAATASTAGSMVLVVSPALIWIAWLVRCVWEGSTAGRVGVAIGAALVIPVGLFAASLIRPSGFNTRLLVLTVDHTGENLVEAVGLLGWLDTVLPAPALLGWCLVVGALAAGALSGRSGTSWGLGAALVVIVTVVSSWLLEMSIERYDGGYWQGRYSLPLFIGMPLLLAVGIRVGNLGPVSEQRFVRVAVIGAVAVTNLGLLSAVRRWGVGDRGSLWPWVWDTYEAPLPVVGMLAVHVAASVLLAGALLRVDASDDSIGEPLPVGLTDGGRASQGRPVAASRTTPDEGLLAQLRWRAWAAGALVLLVAWVQVVVNGTSVGPDRFVGYTVVPLAALVTTTVVSLSRRRWVEVGALLLAVMPTILSMTARSERHGALAMIAACSAVWLATLDRGGRARARLIAWICAAVGGLVAAVLWISSGAVRDGYSPSWTSIITSTGGVVRATVASVGERGWPVPETAQLGWWCGVGLLLGAALRGLRLRDTLVVPGAVLVLVLMAWSIVRWRGPVVVEGGAWLLSGAIAYLGARVRLDRCAAIRVGRALAIVAAWVWIAAVAQQVRVAAADPASPAGDWEFWKNWQIPATSVPPSLLLALAVLVPAALVGVIWTMTRLAVVEGSAPRRGAHDGVDSVPPPPRTTP